MSIDNNPRRPDPAGLPMVSVIMNCYNGERYLREAIDSVRAQTYQNWEIVLWDNQSTDRSREIFESYGDPRMKFFRAPTHTRLYEARNYAIARSEGEFIAFLDVDDWWLPDKLERQIPLFKDAEVGMVCGDYWIVSERKSKRWLWLGRPAPTGWVLNDLLKSYFVGLVTLMVRRAAFNSLAYGCDPRFHIIGDLDLVARLAMHWKLDAVQEPVASYRLHDNNESARHRGLHVQELEKWIPEMQKLEGIPPDCDWSPALNSLHYLKGMDSLLRGDRKTALELLSQLPFGSSWLRMLFSILLPTRIVTAIKN